MSKLLGRGQWKYAWDTADWESRTNVEIASDLGMRLKSEKVASVNVARARRRFAPHTVNRFTGAHGQRGPHGQAKLNPEDVQTIRRLSAAGESNRALADLYGVHPATISQIVTRRTWRRLP